MNLPQLYPQSFSVFSWIVGLLGSWQFWLGVLSGIVLVGLRLRRMQSESITVGLPFGLGNVTYNTTPSDRIVAWKLYIQLVTRKAAIPFDENDDLIPDVFDSLFELFRETRALLLVLPCREFERVDGVAPLMLRVLNDGVRPHLTKWQSGFRKWWSEELQSEENFGITPQVLQRRYPQYEELLTDLKAMNGELAKFADELCAIAQRPKKKRARTPKIIPIAPTVGDPPKAKPENYQGEGAI